MRRIFHRPWLPLLYWFPCMVRLGWVQFVVAYGGLPTTYNAAPRFARRVSDS